MSATKTVYRVQVYKTTAKGKHENLTEVFVNTNMPLDDLKSYYSKRYSPLSVNIGAVDTVDIEVETEKEAFEKIADGGYYSNPSYRISRDSLPEDVQKLLANHDHHKKTQEDIKKKLAEYFETYVREASVTDINNTDLTVRGWLKTLPLS